MSGHHEMSECPEAVTDTPSDTRVLYEKCFDRFMACITGHSCTQIYCFYLLTIRCRSHKRRRKFKLKCPINLSSFKERQVDWKPPYTALLVSTFTTPVSLSVIRRPYWYWFLTSWPYRKGNIMTPWPVFQLLGHRRHIYSTKSHTLSDHNDQDYFYVTVLTKMTIMFGMKMIWFLSFELTINRLLYISITSIASIITIETPSSPPKKRIIQKFLQIDKYECSCDISNRF